MVIRSITAVDADRFAALGTADVRDQLSDAWRSGASRPDWTLLAEEDGRPVARGALLATPMGGGVTTLEGTAAFLWVDADHPRHVDAFRSLADALAERLAPHGPATLDRRLNPEIHDDVEPMRSLLEASGFELFQEKAGFGWTPSVASLPDPDGMRQVTLAEAGREAFLRVMAATTAGTLDRNDRYYIARCGPLPWAREIMTALEGGDETSWLLGTHDDEPAGFVAVSAFDDDTWTIVHIGVVPSHRGHGHETRTIDTPTELRLLADELEAVARSMLGRELRGQPTDRPTKQLGDTVALWMIAVRRLAESGPIAWAAMDARFPPDEDESPKAAPESPLGPPERVASLDLITTFVVGDLVLDHLAYAELVRRGSVPTWRRGVQKVPAMWPALMDTLEDSGDAMLGPARSLDVSLAVARDILVAHRDPDAFELPGYSSWGAVRLERPVLDEDRRRMAEEVVRRVNHSLDHPWPDSYDYQHLVDTISAVPPQLTADVRKGLRRAFRAAGFESPALTTVIRDALRILRLYDEGITGPAPS